MRKKLALGLALVVGLGLVGLFFGSVILMPEVAPVQAQTWPTPQPFAFGGGEFVFFDYIGTREITTTAKTCGPGLETAAYVLADVESQVVVASSGITQFITCTLEFSNDNANWCAVPLTVTTVAISDTGVARTVLACEDLPLFGRYSRACCESSASTRYTVTHKAKAFN